LKKFNAGFTLKERCGETLRDCQDSRLMSGIVGQGPDGRKSALIERTWKPYRRQSRSLVGLHNNRESSLWW